MSNKFKVGDRVKLTGPEYNGEGVQNEICTVTRIDEWVGPVAEDSNGSEWFIDQGDGFDATLVTSAEDPHAYDDEVDICWDEVARPKMLEGTQNEVHNLLWCLNHVHGMIEDGKQDDVVQAYIEGVLHSFGMDVG